MLYNTDYVSLLRLGEVYANETVYAKVKFTLTLRLDLTRPTRRLRNDTVSYNQRQLYIHFWSDLAESEVDPDIQHGQSSTKLTSKS